MYLYMQLLHSYWM